MKIAFVAQTHYFDCAIPNRLPGHEMKVFNYSWGQDTSPIMSEKDNFDIWFFIRGEQFPENNLKQLSGKKVWISTEPIEREGVINEIRTGMNKSFDKKYHYDKTHLKQLRNLGYYFNDEFQLPVNLDMYTPTEIFDEKYDFCFIGRSTPRREEYMANLKHNYKFIHVAHGLIGKDYVNMITKAKINLNLHIDNYPQLQHRVQNLLACGCFVMSELLTHNDDLKPFEHYIPITSVNDLNCSSKRWLDDIDIRNEISNQGLQFVQERFDAVKCWNELIERCENG